LFHSEGLLAGSDHRLGHVFRSVAKEWFDVADDRCRSADRVAAPLHVAGGLIRIAIIVGLVQSFTGRRV